MTCREPTMTCRELRQAAIDAVVAACGWRAGITIEAVKEQNVYFLTMSFGSRRIVAAGIYPEQCLAKFDARLVPSLFKEYRP